MDIIPTSEHSPAEFANSPSCMQPKSQKSPSRPLETMQSSLFTYTASRWQMCRWYVANCCLPVTSHCLDTSRRCINQNIPN
uniref:Uncharacterized protein n=1 Tax=Rhipicephalus appendiculatus TaxID=34631 RepID=A0A131YDI4_RHIAP